MIIITNKENDSSEVLHGHTTYGLALNIELSLVLKSMLSIPSRIVHVKPCNSLPKSHEMHSGH
uniref:Uncharacterized protein n=1 Tax=Cannabis sativa TaxID=3483 RepID=A0A803QZP2_CANSA